MEPMTIREIMEAVGGSLLGEDLLAALVVVNAGLLVLLGQGAGDQLVVLVVIGFVQRVESLPDDDVASCASAVVFACMRNLDAGGVERLSKLGARLHFNLSAFGAKGFVGQNGNYRHFFFSGWFVYAPSTSSTDLPSSAWRIERSIRRAANSSVALATLSIAALIASEFVPSRTALR